MSIKGFNVGGSVVKYDYTELDNKPTIPSAATSAPSDLSTTASVGSSTKYARQDHKHKLPSASDVGAYALPSGGIPKTDLASAVQTSLGKADSALQSAPVSSVDGKTGAVTILPSGGTSGYVLKKNSSSDYDVVWAAESGGGGGGSVSPYTSNPAALGTASPGSSDNYSRGDHVHAMPSASDVGAAPAVTEVNNIMTGAVSQALDAGKLYHFKGSLTSLTLTLSAVSLNQIAHYHCDFDCGSTAPTVTLPSLVTFPAGQTFDANKHYEIDILGNYGTVMSWTIS